MYSGLHNSVASEALSISLSKRDSVSGGGEIKISLEITLMANKQAISEVSIPELGNGCQRPDTKVSRPSMVAGCSGLQNSLCAKTLSNRLPKGDCISRGGNEKDLLRSCRNTEQTCDFRSNACRSNEQSVCVSTLRCPEERQSDKTDYQSESSEPFVEVSHFKTEGIHMLKDLLRPGDFMTKVDLKVAHFMIPIAREYCRRPAKVAAFCMAGKDVSVQPRVHENPCTLGSTVCRSDYRQPRGFLPRPQGR